MCLPSAQTLSGITEAVFIVFVRLVVSYGVGTFFNFIHRSEMMAPKLHFQFR